jgi:hypothetical protein
MSNESLGLRLPGQGRARLARRLGTVFLLAPLVVVGACDRGAVEARRRIAPEYDKETGKLRLLKFDSNGNGIVDTWSYMEGARVVRIEIDKDEDGKIDRWEYYTPEQKLEKIGLSREKDGREDEWMYNRPDGSVERIEISTRRDGKVTRVERYEHDAMISAEEDTDGDGAFDKWETYDGDRLVSVAFDTQRRGTPDRRLIYDANGAARLEVASTDGTFTAVNPRAPAARQPSTPSKSGSGSRNPR